VFWVKAFEYHEICEHVVPGLNFAPEGAVLAGWPPRAWACATVLCFTLPTGCMRCMVTASDCYCGWPWARRNVFSSQYFAPVEVVGLYWHFVDIVWIFLFPLLYLVGGRH
jgi:cytochrome c oxidase subunit 3